MCCQQIYIKTNIEDRQYQGQQGYKTVKTGYN